ncbi:GntR family transcriptional regulator [Lapillicoccus sp.]|uniref:GntR family transcriptional regulator n=1 Tax=Lapillicoccus sp. TaxID=1909287 RepID=UPI0025F54D5C|nr:GntR family transcriptional regulator [Lapillicoccus sp.]
MSEVPEPRVSLNEVAYRRLRSEIITCRLAPGQRLTEKQLAADLGVSTAPLRDALTRLDHEGLIHTVPFKGYRVAPLTPRSIDDLFVVWRIIGPEVIRLGMTRASDDQLAAARAAFDEMGDRVPGDAGAVHDIDLVNATFGTLAEATGNDYLVTVYRRLMGDMSRIRALRLTSEVDDPSATSEGHWVRHVLAERDPDRAAEQARRHIDEVHQRVLQAVVRWPSVMSSEVSVSQPR